MTTRRVLTVSAGALALLFSIPTAASAYPVVGAPELTQNPLYTVPALPSVSCTAVKGTTKASTTAYLKKVVGCLDAAWGKRVKNFVPAEVTIKDTYEHSPCYTGIKVSGSFATSCNRSVEVQLRSDWIKAKSELPVLVGVARAYAGFVQTQTGISEAWWALRYDGEEAEMNEQTHRFYQQADCLAGVSVRSLGRTARDWGRLLSAGTPKEYGRFIPRWYGKPANRLAWFKAGYGSGKPGACNTWKAPSPKVA
ncbi:hypothetical protein ACFYY8_31960 [Streptosporangium sp. NPDC001559]|uniref:hypothetical protein n=1 Tax=Streptosporangium sp. NPDC001559 TaxID=3366187 RepID=UPI0036DFC2FB